MDITPPKDDVFSHSIHKMKDGKVERHFASHGHLNNFNWLDSSDVLQGYSCNFCPFFVTNAAGGNGKDMAWDKLLKTTVTSFRKLLGKDGIFVVHGQSIYHREAVENDKNFLKMDEKPELSIINQVGTNRIEQITINRLHLRPIVGTIILQGR